MEEAKVRVDEVRASPLPFCSFCLLVFCRKVFSSRILNPTTIPMNPPRLPRPSAQVRATDVELSAAKGRLQQVLDVLGLERDFRRLTNSVGQVSVRDKIRTCMHCVHMCARARLSAPASVSLSGRDGYLINTYGKACGQSGPQCSLPSPPCNSWALRCVAVPPTRQTLSLSVPFSVSTRPLFLVDSLCHSLAFSLRRPLSTPPSPPSLPSPARSTSPTPPPPHVLMTHQPWGRQRSFRSCFMSFLTRSASPSVILLGCVYLCVCICVCVSSRLCVSMCVYIYV